MHFSTIFHQHHYSRHDQTGTQLVNPPDCWAQSCVSERKSLQTFSSIGNQLVKHDTQFVILSTVPRCALYSNASLIDRVDTGQGYSAWNATISHCSLSHYTVWGDTNVPCAALQCNRGATSHCCALSHYTRHKSPMVTPYTFQYITSYNITLHLLHNITLHKTNITLYLM